jgi:hypothetical protein
MSVTGHTRHPAIEAALRTAAALTGMEVVFVGQIHDDDFIFGHVLGEIPGVAEGARWPVCDTLCQQMLAGAPRATANAAAEPAYRDVRGRTTLGLMSYVGVPIYGAAGEVVGTLCGIDRGEVVVDDGVLGVLDELAGIVARHINDAPTDVLVRRTPHGWVVDSIDDQTLDSLVSAMALADLLAADLPQAPRPARVEGVVPENERLRLTIAQLEHALTTRVVVEQAIGVVSERLNITPRLAFERLRKAARSRGRRVHDLAHEVVASSTDPNVPLPPELHGRR